MNKKLKNAITRGISILAVFLLISITVAYFKQNQWYLLLFGGMGLTAGITEFAIAMNPEKSQIIRRIVIVILGTMLTSLAIAVGINFQFSEFCFDIYTGIVSGALIQFVVARLIFPLLLGNIFCSRACWDSAVFEFADKGKVKTEKSSKTAALIFTLLIAVSTYILYKSGLIPVSGTNTMRIIFISENILIIGGGILFAKFAGRRAYCKKLCPFILVSGTVARFALFKITPDPAKECISCGKCNTVCPMGIDVREYIKNGKRVNDRNCIVCEKCVTACPENCMSLSLPK